MARALYVNNATTSLSISATAVDTTLTVANGSVFPAPTGGNYVYLTLSAPGGNEIVKLTGRTGNVLTVVRAQDNTVASSFSSGSTVSLRVVAALFDELQAGISLVETTLQDDIDTRATITQLNTVESTLTGSIATVSTALTAETTARTNADTALQTDINTRATVTELTTVETSLTSAIASSATTLTAAYTAADAAVTSAYQSADSGLQGQINTNAGDISAAEANITTLQSATASNTGAIATLQTNLSAEVTNRTNADTTLQGQITTNAGNISTNSANITTLQSATATNTSAIATLTTNLSAEVTNRTNADTTLQGQITTNAAAITTEATTRATADSALSTSVTNLTATVNTKARTFVQTSAPTATATGDLWVDSDDNNKLYRWSGSSWLAVDDGRIATKARTFAQTSAPTATATGDLWVDTDANNKLYRWSGSSWVAVDDGRIATVSASVNNIAEAYATNSSATARLVWTVNTSTNAATITQTAHTGYSDGTWNGSAIKLSADLIELLAKDINFGTNTTYEDTYATLYTTKNNKRLRILGPFPATDDLVMWFGPTTVALNSESKTNGHFCLATDGKIYLGSAELTNSGNLDFTYTNGFVKVRIGNGTNTTNQVSFTGSGGSGSGYTFAHELILTYTTGPVPTLSSSSGSPITVSASGVVGDEARFFVQTTMTDSAGNKVTKSKGGALIWEL